MMKRYTPTLQLLLLAVLMIFMNQLLASPSKLQRCPENMERGCRKMCRESCDALNETDHQECSEEHCIPECVCKQDYIYKSNTSKECVPYAECNVTCPENMHYENCTNGLQATCESSAVPILPEYCSPWCVCDQGYVYHSNRNQTCVLKSQCQA